MGWRYTLRIPSWSQVQLADGETVVFFQARGGQAECAQTCTAPRSHLGSASDLAVLPAAGRGGAGRGGRCTHVPSCPLNTAAGGGHSAAA